MTTNFIDIEKIETQAVSDIKPQSINLELAETLPLKRRDFMFPHLTKINIQGNIRVDIVPSITNLGSTAVTVLAPDDSIDLIQMIDAESELYISLRQDVIPSDKGIAGRVIIFQDDVAKVTAAQYAKCYINGVSPTTQFKTVARDNSVMVIDNVATNVKDSDVRAHTNSTVVALNMDVDHICFWAVDNSNIEVRNLKAFDTVLNADRNCQITADGYSVKVTNNSASGSIIHAENLIDSEEHDDASANSRIEGSNPNPSYLQFGNGVVANAATGVTINQGNQVVVTRIEDVERIERVTIPRV